MILEQLEANMMADVGRVNSNAVQNELKSLGMKHPKARKGFSVIFNRFVELSRQLRDGEITRPDANKAIRINLIPATIDYINWAVNGDPEETPGYVKESDDLNPSADMGLSEGNLLLKYDANKAELQRKLLEHHHVVATAPILPLTKPYLLRDKLSEKGFKNDSFSHYTILERQLVIGIDDNYLKEKVGEYQQVAEAFASLRRSGKLTAKSRPRKPDMEDPKAAGYMSQCMALRTEAITVASQMKSNETVQEALTGLKATKPTRSFEHCQQVEKLSYVIAKVLHTTLSAYDGPVTEEKLLESFVKTTSATLKQPYTVLGGKFNYLNATWLWLMTPKTLGALQSCALGGHFSLTKWGFALQDSSTGPV